jgi:uncharacterized protein (TIGR03435 family)
MFPAVAAVLSALVLAQANASGLTDAFSAASIKPSQLYRAGGEGSGQEHVAFSPTGVTLTNASLSFCMQWAYNVRFYQISGPDRITQDRYDVIAKTDQPASKQQLMSMMQKLLADRFQLKFHRDTRPFPVYELVAPHKAAKLTPSASDQRTGMTIVNGAFFFAHVTMPEFAARLSDLSAFDRPVIDKTGIEGTFDIALSSAEAMRTDPSSIFAAIESLGLRLDNGKIPMEVLVVDHAEKPSEN